MKAIFLPIFTTIGTLRGAWEPKKWRKMAILQLLNNVFGGRGNLKIIVTEFSGTSVNIEQSELRFALHSHPIKSERSELCFVLRWLRCWSQNRFEEQNPILFQFNRGPKFCTGEGEPKKWFYIFEPFAMKPDYMIYTDYYDKNIISTHFHCGGTCGKKKCHRIVLLRLFYMSKGRESWRIIVIEELGERRKRSRARFLDRRIETSCISPHRIIVLQRTKKAVPSILLFGRCACFWVF